MFKHILIATDGSGLAGQAASHGLELASKLNAKVTAVTVTEPWTEPYPISPTKLGEVYERAAAENAASALAAGARVAGAKGVSCATGHVKDRQAHEGIVDTAMVQGCDLIVVGSHGRRGVGRLLLGSVVAKVVVLSTVPVLICRLADGADTGKQT